MAKNQGRHVYTDGSYTWLSSGAAEVVLASGTKIEATGRFKVRGATSAYCAEVIAFTEAMAYIHRNTSHHPMYMYTGCLSLLQARKNPDCADPSIDHIRSARQSVYRS